MWEGAISHTQAFHWQVSSSSHQDLCTRVRRTRAVASWLPWDHIRLTCINILHCPNRDLGTDRIMDHVLPSDAVSRRHKHLTPIQHLLFSFSVALYTCYSRGKSSSLQDTYAERSAGDIQSLVGKTRTDLFRQPCDLSTPILLSFQNSLAEISLTMLSFHTPGRMVKSPFKIGKTWILPERREASSRSRWLVNKLERMD